MWLIRLMDVQKIYLVYYGRQLKLCGLHVEFFSVESCGTFDLPPSIKGLRCYEYNYS
jgi:hypothetical protein